MDLSNDRGVMTVMTLGSIINNFIYNYDLQENIQVNLTLYDILKF